MRVRCFSVYCVPVTSVCALIFAMLGVATLSSCEGPFDPVGQYTLTIDDQMKVSATYADRKGLPLLGTVPTSDDLRLLGPLSMSIGAYEPAVRVMHDVRVIDSSSPARTLAYLPAVALNDQHVQDAVVSRVTQLVGGYPGCRMMGELRLKFVFVDSKRVDVMFTQFVSLDTVDVTEKTCDDLLADMSLDISSGRPLRDPFAIALRASTLDVQRLKFLRSIEVATSGTGNRT